MPIVVSPRGTRGSELPRLPGPLMSAMQGLFHLAYRMFGDRMRVQGRPLLELETVGAKSGARRHAVLGWFPDTFDGPAQNASESINSWLVVASNAGSARHPAWFLNLAKHPDQVWITLGRRRIKVAPETLDGAEREPAWQQITSLAPGYAGYQQKTDRAIPIVRLRAQREEP
jgi:deazaflavin-dependent oxidoreductase (nitroreductase family)